MTINPKHEIGKDDDFMDILGLIEYEVGDDVELNVGDVPLFDKHKLMEVYNNCYKKALKPEAPEIDYEVNISLKDFTPFNYRPRRLSYAERDAVKDIICDLLDQGIIRKVSPNSVCP